ncbi:hypothetical protein [Candidatus Parabeggiatoa sp. HSG14]|uniref:hypothetical protein n=1 Tax=Candidatus Parabeggiatoa sp. HSG14 TaxID=3055593 RepID=UPI0025A92B8A|nr:hypothetical protein [Thiotrichales bacterium HSG14]
MPGTYRYFDPLQKMQVELYDLSVPEFEHNLTDFFIKEYAEAVYHFNIIELKPHQTALVYKNGRLVDILSPSTRTFYWKGIVDITTEIIDISENFEVASNISTQLVHAKAGILSQRVSEFIYSQEVPENQLGLLYVNARFTCLLAI